MTETVIEEYTAEEVAWHAALDAAPEDDGLRLVFSDWLRDQGKDELADGFAALGRLPVRLSPIPDDRLQGGVNCYSTTYALAEVQTRSDRRMGRRWFVTSVWREAVFEAWGGYQGYCSREDRRAFPAGWELERVIALTYARLPADQKDNAERLLKLEDR